MMFFPVEPREMRARPGTNNTHGFRVADQPPAILLIESFSYDSLGHEQSFTMTPHPNLLPTSSTADRLVEYLHTLVTSHS
jgi:hypothetical protein